MRVTETENFEFLSVTTSPNFIMSTPRIEQTRSPWIVVADWPVVDCPDEFFAATSVWNLNAAEFAIGVNSEMYGSRSVFKYNVRSDTWTSFLSELVFDSYSFEIEIDRKNRRVFASDMDCTIIFDMETKSVVHRVQAGLESIKMVNVNGTMHCMGRKGYCDDPTHHIWSEDKMYWQEIKTNIIANVEEIVHLIHVPSKNILLMFTYRKSRCGKKCEIWRNEIPSKEWENVMDIPIEYRSDVLKLAVTLTTEEHFIIIKQENKSHFQILDIRNKNEYKLRDSTMCVPRYAFFGVLARSQGTPGFKQSLTLTMGWARRLEKLENCAKLSIPVEIERMIAEWYSTEWIHWIMGDVSKQKNCTLRNHQKITLHNMLNEIM